MQLYITTAVKRIASCQNKVVIVQGGARAGKTFAILLLIVDYCLRNPNSKVGIFSFSYPHLKRGAIADFLNIVKATGHYKVFAYNKADKIFRFANGSEVHFITAEKVGDIQGTQFDITFVNEARYVKFDVFNQILMRSQVICYIDFNPTQRFYVHDMINTRKDVDFIKLTYKDNEACPPSIVQELQYIESIAHTSTYWSNYAKVFVHGEIGSSIDAVFPDWKTIKEVPSNARLVSIGVDFGFTNDVTAIVAIYYYDNSYILKELAYKTRMLTKDISDVLKPYNCPIYCDAAEPRTINEINIMLKTNRLQGVKFGINETIDLVNRQMIYVTYDSSNIQREQMNYLYKRDRYTGELTNMPIDEHNHAMDAIRYGLGGFLMKKFVYVKNF